MSRGTNGGGNGAGATRRGPWQRLRGLFVRGEGSFRESLEELIEESHSEEGGSEIEANERTLLLNILKMRDLTAYDVMVPRADIVGIEESTSLAEAVDVMIAAGHSRLPVYRETLDDSRGMVHVKDLLRTMVDNEAGETRLLDLSRGVLFVAPSVRVLDLLWQMRLTRTHMALVVDEYGGIDGLITIEDLVETIVGEIEDEHDQAGAVMMTRLPDGSILADARTPVDELEDQVGPFLTDEERDGDIDTLGGVVFMLVGRVPARGELIAHPSGLDFEVLDADLRRIKRLRVRLSRLGTRQIGARGQAAEPESADAPVSDRAEDPPRDAAAR